MSRKSIADKITAALTPSTKKRKVVVDPSGAAPAEAEACPSPSPQTPLETLVHDMAALDVAVTAERVQFVDLTFTLTGKKETKQFSARVEGNASRKECADLAARVSAELLCGKAG